MITQDYEQLIVSSIKNLPAETLREIANFVYFVRRKSIAPESFAQEQERFLLERDLSELDENELKLLETEFADYEKLHPILPICS